MRLSILTALACLALLVPAPGAAAERFCTAMYWGDDKGVYAGMCEDGSEEPYCTMLDVGTGGVSQNPFCTDRFLWFVEEGIREIFQGPLRGVETPGLVVLEILP